MNAENVQINLRYDRTDLKSLGRDRRSGKSVTLEVLVFSGIS